MESGYLLRDVVNLINRIHFDSSEEMHTLSALYETMLQEMRDAAGDSGEFYTPRPVVQLMVVVTDPRLGEVVEDPACGTGGFQVEAYTHMAAQCQTAEDRQGLQDSIRGGEAKPLRYEEFAPLLAWWERREENEHAWRVPLAAVLKYDASGALLSANLDLKNPNSGDALEHLAPEELVAGIMDKERRILALMAEIQQALGAGA
jgi:hypothetical protein